VERSCLTETCPLPYPGATRRLIGIRCRGEKNQSFFYFLFFIFFFLFYFFSFLFTLFFVFFIFFLFILFVFFFFFPPAKKINTPKWKIAPVLA